MTKKRAWTGGWLALALMAGCGNVPTGMRPAQSPPSYGAPSDQAAVIFVRHSSLGKKINFPVVDQNDQWVAGMRGKMHTVVFVPPGEQKFYVIAENCDPIHADLQAGLTYVVETRPRMGWGKARVTAEAVHKGTPRAQEAGRWIADTPAMTVVDSEGQAWVQKHSESVQSRRQNCEAAWAKQDAEWQSAHTLKPEDGMTPSELGL